MADYNINAVTRRVVYTGSAGVGPYAFTFEILDDDDLAVYFNSTKLTKTTDYNVTINANGTGSVTLVVNVGGNVPQTPVASDGVIVVGARDIERTTDFVTAGDLLASSLNEQLDSLTIFDQQIAEEEKRTLQAPVYDPAHVDEGGTLDMTLPAKADRAGKTLQFNATTGNPEAGPTIDEVANAQTYANNAATSATASASSATAAASSATSASAASAAAQTAQTAAETAETNAGTSETNASTSETNAASSASSASTSATTATTQAGISTAQAVIATTQATNSSNSATASANSATASANSATAAASSASAAATSETNAANSAAAAASAFDNFDDTYLGSKTSDPTVDNDGDPLTQGDLYFNSTANEMRVYDGVNWIAASSSGAVSLILYEYTATSGQTTFSGADDNAATLSYRVGNIQIVMNGVVLDPSDFTATSGTSVVLASGATTGDLVNIYAFKSFTVADTVSASAGGTFAANVNITARLDVDNLRLDGNAITSIDTDGDITLTPNGSGSVVIDGLSMPQADGSANQVLKTDGSGNLGFTTFLPSGTVLPFAGSTAPSGYQLCYGQAISRTTYASLFSAIGTTYGSGDGSTTFNVPDLRGRTIAGQDDMGGSSANRLTNQSGGVDGDTLGGAGGAETHTLTTAQLASHSHSATSLTLTDADDTGSTPNSAEHNPTGNLRQTYTPAIGSTGGDSAHNNVQPTLILNYMIAE